MKFACDKCNTRYSIADERVRGRVLKIRCKACNHVITVREETHEPLNELAAPDNEHTMVSTAPPAAREDAADEWFVSFDGEQEGPLPLMRAIDRVRSERPAGKECYCWRNGFFVWLPVEDVPDFAPALAKPLPPPPLPALRAPSGAQAAVRSPSGAQAAVGKITGAQAAVRSPSGAQAAVGKISGAPAALKSPSGAQAAVGRSTGPVPKITGSQPVVSGRVTGAQPTVGKSTGSQPSLHKSSSLPAPAFDLPGFDSGPLGTPNVVMPALPTKPEPRVARREEAHASSLAAAEGAAAVSPFAAALQAAGATQVSDAPPGQLNVPRPEPKLDTGPVPLPPPPGDDLPIGEASGLISLAHISKAALSKPSSPPKSIETFGGIPVMSSSSSPIPSAIMAAPGAAPSSAPAWMKWAALAGAAATIGLGVVVVMLMMRKPTVIVVPPAPQLDDKKVRDNPILLADPGPSPGQNAGAAQNNGNDSEPSKHNGKQHARAAKPTAKSGGEDKPLNGEQGKLAALYRDDSEHAVPTSAHVADRGSGGGNVSQQAIMAVVTQNRRSLNLCYDRVLKHDSSLKSGRVLTHVKVGVSGSVTGVNVPDPQYANSEIGQCIAQTIRRWHFPSADSEYETEFPIILQAN